MIAQICCYGLQWSKKHKFNCLSAHTFEFLIENLTLKFFPGGHLAFIQYGRQRWKATTAALLSPIFWLQGHIPNQKSLWELFTQDDTDQPHWLMDYLMFPFICAWMNGWANNRKACDLRRHRAHYDANVMEQLYCRKCVHANVLYCQWLVWLFY